MCYSFGTYESIVWFILDVGGANTLTGYQVPTNTNIVDGTALASALNTLTTGDGITWTYSTVTAKLTFTNSTGHIIKMVSSYRYSENTNIYNDCHDKLGFTSDMSATTIANAGTLTAANPVSIIRTMCYYLTCDILSSSDEQSIVPDNYYRDDPIIAQLPAGNFGSISQFAYLPPTRYGTQFKDITRMKFSLLDDQFRPITIGESPIIFKLIITLE
jgi:hypothetical protein